MSLVLKSNNAGTAVSVYPAGMESFVARVLADGATISDRQFQELYTVFKAIEDASLYGSSALIAAVCASGGVKVSGGFITKIYDLFHSGYDFTGVNTASNGWTLDTSTGTSLIVPDPAAGTGVSRGCFRAGTTATGVAGTLGVLAAFSLNNPTTTATTQIAIFENVSATTSYGGVLSGPTGDGNSRIGLQSYDVSLANQGFSYRKGVYAARRFFGGLHTNGVKALYQDGQCVRNDAKTTDTYYAGKSLTPAIGNVNSAPDFKLRCAIWFNGNVTQAQFKALQASLAALP